MVIPRSVLLRMRNVSNKICRENQNTFFHFRQFLFQKKSTVYEKNVQKYRTASLPTDDNIIWRMRNAYWIPKATNTHSEYAILIVFPPQQCLHERASMLRCMYNARIVHYKQSVSVYSRYSASLRPGLYSK